MPAWWSEFVDALYPRRCWLCGVGCVDGFACPEHDPRTSEQPPRCGRCAARLGRGLPDGFPCAGCRRSPPPVKTVLTCGDYRAEGALREWILALKHRGRADLAGPLGALLAERLQGAHPEALLVPVPLHPLRRFERGYDQAARLAHAVGEAAGLRCAPALIRNRCTAVQGDVGAPSRMANVRGAFSMDPGWPKRVSGREVWLVDDVVTSGSTVFEGARVLRRAGAQAVGVLCLARAGSPVAGGSFVG